MNSRLFSSLMAATLALPVWTGSVSAGEIGQPVGVVELFTSQGCSSCPPADAVFSTLAADPSLVTLAYHVDYWDYLGWRDTLATAENTARQYDYMRSFGTRSVYTPQAVINGLGHVNGASRTEISAALSAMTAAGEGPRVPVTATRSGESVLIEAGAAVDDEKSAHVVLVYFDPARPVEIQRGENAGSVVTYMNAVTGIQTAGMWHGEAARFELPASELARKGTGGYAVLLQATGSDGVPGAILGATVIRNRGS